MKHLVIAAISLSSVSAPAVAERHCQAPETPFPYFDYAAAGEDRDNQLQAFLLTYDDLLHDQKVRTLEVCESKGEEFFYDCDAPEFGSLDDVNPDYFGLTEDEFEAQKDANRLRALNINDAIAACIGEG